MARTHTAHLGTPGFHATPAPDDQTVGIFSFLPASQESWTDDHSSLGPCLLTDTEHIWRVNQRWSPELKPLRLWPPPAPGHYCECPHLVSLPSPTPHRFASFCLSNNHYVAIIFKAPKILCLSPWPSDCSVTQELPPMAGGRWHCLRTQVQQSKQLPANTMDSKGLVYSSSHLWLLTT